MRNLIDEGVSVFSALDSNQDHFGEAIADPLVRRKEYVVQKATPVVDAVRRKRRRHATPAEGAQVIVLASGNLGLVYLTEWRKRVSHEEIIGTFPSANSGTCQPRMGRLRYGTITRPRTNRRRRQRHVLSAP